MNLHVAIKLIFCFETQRVSGPSILLHEKSCIVVCTNKGRIEKYNVHLYYQANGDKV